jgi:nicotinate phosphoribosyltransferase
MIITSLLDTDLYKFTMMQVVLHQFPGAQVEYRFRCRNPGVALAPYVRRDPRRDPVACAACISRTRNWPTCARCGSSRATLSISWGCSGSTRKYITVTALPSGEIDITIHGPWLHTILFEIPVLAIVNEVYFRNTTPVPDFVEGRKRLDEKITPLHADRPGRAEDCRLRHPPAFLQSLARGGAARADCAPGRGRSRTVSPAPATCCSP